MYAAVRIRYWAGITLLATEKGIGTIAMVLLNVPVTLLGYWVPIGFGSDSVLLKSLEGIESTIDAVPSARARREPVKPMAMILTCSDKGDIQFRKYRFSSAL